MRLWFFVFTHRKEFEMRKKQWLVVALAAAILPRTLWAVIVVDPAYNAETYIEYPLPNGSAPKGLTFDSTGNLYVTHESDGSIYRVDPDKNVTCFVEGLDSPYSILWAADTSYGDNLFVTDVYANGNIGKILLITIADKKVYTFCKPWNQPVALEIDRYGGYGGYMYTGTGGLDHIDRIDPVGGIQQFSDFPHNMAGGPGGIAFDPGVDYGGLMYVANYSGANSPLAGVFSLDINGNQTRFAPDIVNAVALEFDPSGLVDNQMLIKGMLSSDSLWSLYLADSSGQITPFAGGSWGHIMAMTFGADGALYVAEYRFADGMSVITRIVPEPASLALLVLGAVRLLRRRKSIR